MPLRRTRVTEQLCRSAGVTCQALERRMLLSLAPAGPEFRINTFTPGDQNDHSVAMDADGDFVAVWTSDAQDGSGHNIHAQRYDRSGAPQGGEFRVNTHTTGTQWAPDVAVEPAGNFVVAWANSPEGFRNDVYAQRFDAQGAPQGGEFRVNTYTTEEQRFPQVATDTDGDFVIAWSSRGQEGTVAASEGIYAQRYDAGGAPQGGEFHVNTYTTGTQLVAGVAMSSGGDFVIGWTSGDDQDGSGYGVYAQRYDPSGIAQGGEMQVNSFTTGIQIGGYVDMDGVGNFVIAWDSGGQDGSSYGVYAKRYNASGAAQAPEFRVNTVTAGPQQTQSVALDADGDFIVAWQSSDGSGFGVFAQCYSADGIAQDGEFQVNTFTTFSQSAPLVATNDDGAFVAVWESAGQDGSGAGIYAQRYESIDAAGPVVDGVFVNGARVPPYTVQQAPVEQIVVSFSETVANATDPANWLLTRDGADISAEISSVTFGHNPTTNRHEAVLNLATPQTSGNFLVLARDTLIDAAGNALDGDSDGAPGGSFALPFSIAAVAPQGGDFQVNTYKTDLQDLPQVAADAAGNFVVVWHSVGQDGDSNGVHAQRYNAHGVPLGAEFRVNTTTTGNQEYPAVAMDADGDFVVAWQNGGQTVQGIYAQRFSANGIPQGGEFVVAAGIKSAQTSPRVAMDADGDFVVTWTSYTSFVFQDVYARRYNSAGVAQGGAFIVNTYTPDAQTTYGIAMDTDGDFVIAWHSYGQDGSDWGVYAQRYSATGIPRGAEFRANTYTTSHQLVGGVAMDADGDFVITWNSEGQDGSLFGVYARRFAADGLPQGPEFRVNSYSTGQQFNPSISMDDHGESVITWTSDEQDGSSWGLYAQSYDAAGAPRGGEFRVNSQTTGPQEYPSVALDEDGDFVVVWRGFDQSFEVFGGRYILDDTPTVGTLTDSPDPVSAGSMLTLSATGVTDDGTVTSVSFYRESNGIAGLQVGFQGDAQVGTANSAAGGVWSVDVPAGALVVGTYTYWAQATDDGNLTGTPASATNTVIPSNPPVVTNSAFHSATLPHALSFTFNQDVSASLALDDFIIIRLPSGQEVGPQDVTYDATTNVARLTFANPLRPGRYRATVLAAGVTNAAGEPMSADHTFEFTFRRGGATSDGRDSPNDFDVRAAHFGQSPRDATQGGFDYSGRVNLDDFNVLAARFGTVLASSAGASSAAAQSNSGDRIIDGLV